LPLIEQHIQTLIRLKGERSQTQPEIIFNMVGLPELMNQVQAYVDRWIPHSTQVMVSRYRPMGSRRFPGHLVPDNRRPCPNPDYQMVVSWDGRVALCCEDIHCHVELGNLNNQNISQVFNGAAVNAVREAHLQHQWKDVPFCTACDTWCAGDVIRETRDEKGIVCRETPAQWVYIPG
jgi:radical SAM protein with 4Fe4S-binding SPASM domain